MQTSTICLCCGERISERAEVFSGNHNLCDLCSAATAEIDEAVFGLADTTPVGSDWSAPTRRQTCSVTQTRPSLGGWLRPAADWEI